MKKRAAGAAHTHTDSRNITTKTLARSIAQRYGLSVAAKSATEIGVSESTRRTPPQSGFFVSAAWQVLYGRAVRGLLREHRLLVAGTPTLHGSALPDWRRGSGQQHRTQGLKAMTPRHTLALVTPTPRIKAARHRRMALAALKLDSSLSVRLARYWSHIEKARALESVGGAK